LRPPVIDGGYSALARSGAVPDTQRSCRTTVGPSRQSQFKVEGATELATDVRDLAEAQATGFAS